PAGPVHYWDEANVLEVQLDDPGAVLLNHSPAAVLRGANALLLGAEILQFREAVALGDGLWRLSGLLRGRLGTEAAVATHGAAEQAVLLEAEGLTRLPLPLDAVGMARQLKAVTFETDPELVPAESHLPRGRALRPWAPVHLKSRRESNGDWTLTWVRRARLDRGWRDGVDVALEEAQER